MAHKVHRFFLLAIIWWGAPVWASCDGADARYQDISCAIEAFDLADAALNKAYQKLMALQDKEGQQKLREAQRAWVAWRDADARFSSYGEGDGSQGRLVLVNRRLDLTTSRTEELNQWSVGSP